MDRDDLTEGWLGGGDADLACDHRQQAAEKDLKGVPAESGSQVPMMHDPKRLADRGREVDGPIPDLYDAALLSDPYSGVARYPVFDIPLEARDAEEALVRAGEVAYHIPLCRGGCDG